MLHCLLPPVKWCSHVKLCIQITILIACPLFILAWVRRKPQFPDTQTLLQDDSENKSGDNAATADTAGRRSGATRVTVKTSEQQWGISSAIMRGFLFGRNTKHMVSGSLCATEANIKIYRHLFNTGIQICQTEGDLFGQFLFLKAGVRVDAAVTADSLWFIVTVLKSTWVLVCWARRSCGNILE